MFVFLFSTLLSQIYAAVVEAVLAGIECYAKTSTESKVNEAPILYIVIVGLDFLKYKITCKPKLKKKKVLVNYITLMKLILWLPSVFLNYVKKKKIQRISNLNPFAVVFPSFMNCPSLIVRKIRYVTNQILAWCISVVLFSVWSRVCLTGAPVVAGISEYGKRYFILNFPFYRPRR